jgi:hypothetical protein
MLCPECKTDGQKSCVYSRGGSTTLMGGGATWWDETGIEHYGDPNKTTTVYACSRGHLWNEREFAWCPGCQSQGCKKSWPPSPPTT